MGLTRGSSLGKRRLLQTIALVRSAGFVRTQYVLSLSSVNPSTSQDHNSVMQDDAESFCTECKKSVRSR